METLAAFEVAQRVRSGEWRVALPSELEWEKAARGGLTGAIFSWGDEADPNRANYGDSGIATTSPVGCFPTNGLGLHDMLGNVFEWTRSLWGKNPGHPDFVYPYRWDDRQREDPQAGDDVLRIVRGGSWGDCRDFVRCAYRFRACPDGRDYGLGFRVVLRSVLAV